MVTFASLTLRQFTTIALYYIIFTFINTDGQSIFIMYLYASLICVKVSLS